MSHHSATVAFASPEHSTLPLDELKQELLGVQLEIALHEARQRDVRLQLQHCRIRRTALGREYHRLIVQRDLQS